MTPTKMVSYKNGAPSEKKKKNGQRLFAKDSVESFLKGNA